MRGIVIRTTDDRGLALVGVMLALAMLMGLAAALAVTVSSDTQLRGAFGRSTTGLYAAESGLNRGMGEFKNIFLNFNVPSGSDFAPRSFPLGSRTVNYALAEKPGNPRMLTIPSGELFGGLNAQQYTYTVGSSAGIAQDIEASVGAEFNVGYIPLFQFIAFYANDLEILPGPIMNLNGRVHTNGDLYLNAENQLNIVDNPGAGITTVQVSARGDLYRGRKNNTACNGTVTVDKLDDRVLPSPDLDPQTMACGGGTRRKIPVSELATWKGSIISQMQSISVPEPDIIAKGGGEFWRKADLRIVLRLNAPDQLEPGNILSPVLPHTVEVQDKNGVRDAALTTALHNFMRDAAFNTASSSVPGTPPIFYTDVPNSTCNCTNASPVGCNNATAACYTPSFKVNGVVSNARVYRSTPFDLDYRRGGFYNWREHKWMLLLNINVRDLIAWNTAKGSPFFDAADTSDGGLVIFASVQGPSSNTINNYGVRIFGSANLPIPGGIGVSANPTGLTMVSDQAIYVLGDYNRGRVNAGDLPKQPAALIGDSVNVMSNNYWQIGCASGCRNDSQSNRSLGDATRAGSSTRINSAFLGGVDNTTGGTYNGGLENYPRFHESWSAATLTYQGSFVSLGTPVHVNGIWCGTGGTTTSGCNIYDPPARNWNFDPDFNNAANLPPLTPRFVYVQQVLFTESFK